MVFQVTKELNQIIMVNQSIIASMKAQQARSYKELDRLQTKVQVEAELPSNRFLDWSKIVDSYISSVINSRVIDYEMLKRYEAYVKDLIKHNHDYFVAQDELDNMQTNFESMLSLVLRMEDKLMFLQHDLEEARRDAARARRVPEKSIGGSVNPVLLKEAIVVEDDDDVPVVEKVDDKRKRILAERFEGETSVETLIDIMGENVMERRLVADLYVAKRQCRRDSCLKMLRDHIAQKVLKVVSRHPMRIKLNPKSVKAHNEAKERLMEIQRKEGSTDIVNDFFDNSELVD